uniref:Uncharacterized protein n=1 Tax=Panagrolaimus superbus TaxID=310955 RepID=A0A914YA16_9BILA
MLEYSPKTGDLSYNKEGKKKGQHLKIISVKHDDEIVRISYMYDEIKSKIGLNFGNVCICLDEKYTNEIRAEFIEQGLNCGFKNIKIINSQTLLYLNAMSEIKYKPLNGNAIWIESEKNFYLWNLWKIVGKKAVYFGEFNGDSSRLVDLQKNGDQKSEFIDLPSYDEINLDFKIDENENLFGKFRREA